MEQSVTKNLANADVYKVFQAPRVGLEPTTPRLTAACSTIELSRIILFSCTFSSVCDRVVALPLSYRGPSSPYTLKNPYRDWHTPHPHHAYSDLPWSSPRPISCSQLRALLHFHPCPTYLVVSKGSYSLKDGRSHLGGGFALRCLQRLSRPGLATLPWHWHANRSTSGPSIPVLSYWGQRPADLLRPRRIGTELSHDVLNPARVPL